MMLKLSSTKIKAFGPLVSAAVGIFLFLFVKVDAPVTSIEMIVTVFPDDGLFQVFYSEDGHYTQDKSTEGLPYTTPGESIVVFRIPRSHQQAYKHLRFDFPPNDKERRLHAIRFYSGKKRLLSFDAASIYSKFFTSPDIRTFVKIE